MYTCIKEKGQQHIRDHVVDGKVSATGQPLAEFLVANPSCRAVIYNEEDEEIGYLELKSKKEKTASCTFL